MAQPKAKDYQERIIRHTKSGELGELIDIVQELSALPPGTDWIVGVGKMAINISASLVGGGLGHPRLQILHESVCSLITSYPALAAMESVEYSYAKIKLSVGLLDSALELALNSDQPRLRIFSAIIEHCSQHHNIDVALSILDSISSRQLLPTEVDFSNVVKSMALMDSWLFRSKFLSVLDQISEVVDGPLESPELVNALMEVLSVQKFCVHREVHVPETSVCPISNVTLQVVPLSEAEIDEMLDLTSRLVLESSSEGRETLSVLSEIFAQPQPPTVFLDGANIAHTNQNFANGFFRFDQIDDIANHFISEHRKCMIVLHSKWTNVKKDLRISPPSISGQKRKKRSALPRLGAQGEQSTTTPSDGPLVALSSPDEASPPILPPLPLIDSWRAQKLLLEIPHGQNDDWFWMHACCLAIKSNKGAEVPFLVSNDQMRDHFWRMHTPKFFKKFYRNHVCKYSIKFDGEAETPVNNYEYILPPPHSIVIQKHGDVVHIPYKKEDRIVWCVIDLAGTPLE